MLHVVEAGVEEEDDFRHDAQLFAHSPSEFAPQSLDIFLEPAHHRVCLCGREDAHVDFCHGEVRADFHSADAHQGPVKCGHPFAADNLRHFPLDFPRHLQLAGAFCCIVFQILFCFYLIPDQYGESFR